MESPLRDKIVVLATRFADEILDAVSSMLAQQLRVEPGDRIRPVQGRGGGRSSEEIGRAVERIVEVLAQSPEGLRSEKLRAELGFSRGQMLRPLAHALKSGRVRKVGERRRTIYSLSEGAAAAATDAARPSAPRAAKKRSPKRGLAKKATSSKPASSRAGSRSAARSAKAKAPAKAES